MLPKCLLRCVSSEGCQISEIQRSLQKVRMLALQYLERLPSIIRYDILHPSKSIVVKGLGKVLDDPKRAVRKEAVDARTAW